MLDHTQKEKIGQSLGRIPSGVAILTTQHREIPGAMLASWFQQASFDPPLVSVAIKKGRPIVEIIQTARKFVLNILHTGQKDMISHFGRGFEPGEDPFKGIKIINNNHQLPILKHSLCYLECQLHATYEAGDHQIYLGEVIHSGVEEEGQPMVHLRRNGFNY